jgi:DNA-binding NtrC family response regulator
MPERATEKARTALVVDGSEAIRVLLTAFLSRAGFAVDSADHIDSAVSKLRCCDFDVVVVDPACSHDGDGIGHLASAYPDVLARTVVIASPPYASLSKAVHSVLDKPFELDSLLAAALECSRSRDLHRT